MLTRTKWDWRTSIEEVMNGLHYLVASGKVRYLHPNYTRASRTRLRGSSPKRTGKTPFCIYQGGWSILRWDFERDIIPMAREEGLALAPFNVLGGGRIRTDEEEHRRVTGEKGRTLYTEDWECTEEERKVCQALEEVAQQVGAKNIHAVALAYVMHKTPYVFPVVGARKVSQLQGNIEALSVSLSPDHIAHLDSESVVPFDPGFPHIVCGDGSEYNWMLHATACFDMWPRAQAIRPTN